MKSYLRNNEFDNCGLYVDDIFSFIRLARRMFFGFFVCSAALLIFSGTSTEPFRLFYNGGNTSAYRTILVSLNILFFFCALLFAAIGYINVSSYKLSSDDKRLILGTRLRLCRLLMALSPFIIILRETYFNQTWTLMLFPVSALFILIIAAGTVREPAVIQKVLPVVHSKFA